MQQRYRYFQGWLAGAAILTLAACSGEAPNQGPLDPAAVITPGPGTIAVQVCKVADDAETLGDVFTINTSAADGNVISPVQVTAFLLGEPGVCEVVWTRGGASFDDETQITITEVLPAGYHLDRITFTGTGNYALPAPIEDPVDPSVTIVPLDGMTVYFKNSFVFTPPPPPPPPPPPGDEGCTPGYWKVEQHWDSWGPTGYTTDQLVTSVFSGVNANQAGATLLEALDFVGGPGVDGAERILLRAAVAGLLNAAHPDVDYAGGNDVTAFIDAVNAALATDDRDVMLALAASIDADNNAGCSLN